MAASSSSLPVLLSHWSEQEFGVVDGEKLGVVFPFVLVMGVGG